MAEIKNNCPVPGTFKEAVCIDADRIYDSCCDRDCLEDLRCYFSSCDEQLIQNARSVRVRSAEVINVCVDVEPVHFNRGYYACDITFFFLVELDLFDAPCCKPTQIKGVCYFDKKVILYGSEGGVKIFSNDRVLDDETDLQVRPTTNMPRCTVQVVDPIPLSARICEVKNCFECCPRPIPRCVCDCVGGDLCTECPAGEKTIYVTLGVFSIVQLSRNVQMLIPVYDFCMPEKQCDDNIDQPCDVFRRIKFPTNDFFPPRPCDIGDNDFGCCCNRD